MSHTETAANVWFGVAAAWLTWKIKAIGPSVEMPGSPAVTAGAADARQGVPHDHAHGAAATHRDETIAPTDLFEHIIHLVVCVRPLELRMGEPAGRIDVAAHQRRRDLQFAALDPVQDLQMLVAGRDDALMAERPIVVDETP